MAETEGYIAGVVERVGPVPVVKVVILNWNGEGVLPRFMPSVVANTPPEVEVVVADNGSTDGSVELLGRDFPSVRVLTLDRNHGFAEGYNRALAALDAEDAEDAAAINGTVNGAVNRADGGAESHVKSDMAGDPKRGPADIYILLNSDVETPAGWCEPLVEALTAHPDVAAVAPKVLSWAERDSFEYAGASGGFIDALGYPFCRGRMLDTTERDRGQYDSARDVFWATGACMACRADIFRALGGFDGAFFAHQEEIDLCWRMQLAGWRVRVAPHSVVYHLGAGTLPPSPRKLYLNFRNNRAMLYKNLPAGWMQAVLAVRWMLDLLSATVWLAQGKRDNFRAVVRAHRDFRAMRRGEFAAEGDPKTARGTASGATSEAAYVSPLERASEPSLRDKRRTIQRSRRATPRGVYRGSVVLAYLLGLRAFSRLKIR